MAFSFTNYVSPELQKSPLNEMIKGALGGYRDVTQSKYLKPTIEADIFHKQIAPLAMLASSPYFSSLYPQQQQQIAGYISQMISNQGVDGGGPMGQIPGIPGQGNGMPGTPNNQGGNYNAPGNDSLAPRNPAEHFTGKFTESPYSSGTAHRGMQGETIYAPTGGNVQKGLDVLTEAKGLKKIFDEYAKLAPTIGGAGGFKRDLSNVASGISKTNLPFSHQIAQFLGGSALSDQVARAESYRAQIAPALRAIGFSNDEINNMLKFYPGETGENIAERLKNTWPLIEQKIKTHQQNLNKGINVNQNVIGENEVPRSIEEKIARDEKERAEEEKRSRRMAPNGYTYLYRNNKRYTVPVNQVERAINEGGLRYEG